MAILYVVGGRAKPNAQKLEEFHGFERALIVEIDTETQKSEVVASWVSPDEAHPDEDPSFIFKAGTLTHDRLWVCTQTEVMGYALPSFEMKEYISLPFFNDVHHVTPTSRGTLLVAVTGLDMVAEMTTGGEVLGLWDVLNEPLWSRFSKDIDYRKVPTTKPHKSHPNYVFEMDGKFWATRFSQKDAVALTGAAARIAVDVAGPHDGHVQEDGVYFTTVNGNIVIGGQNGAAPQVIDLYPILGVERGQPQGWCRGIKKLSEGGICIGFSRLRPTVLKDSLRWVRDRMAKATSATSQFTRAMPTRICCFDVEKRALAWEINLERHGINAIFSIHERGRPDIETRPGQLQKS